MEEPLQERSVEAYITLLNVEPENKIDKYFAVLSDAQVNSISEELKKVDLDKLKEAIQTKFSAESEENKRSANKPMNDTQREEVKEKTRTMAEKFIRVQNNLQQIIQTTKSQAVKTTKPRFASFKHLSLRRKSKSDQGDTEKRRSSSAGNLFGKLG